MMLPKAGIFAHKEAHVVAHRIADEINEREPRTEFCGTGYCMLEAGQGMAGVLFWDTFEPGLRAALERLTVETQGISEDRAALYIGWNTWAAEAGKMLFTLQETEADHKVA